MKSIAPFVAFIRDQMGDENFDIKLNPEWNSQQKNYRENIRQHLATIDSSYFTRQQLAQLYDLQKRPEAAEGYISISHCQSIGGYSFSTFKHGFDTEELKRISDPILLRTSTDDERAKAPHIKFLWVAKEATYKALSESGNLITDLVCKNWVNTADLDIWSFQIQANKAIQSEHNIGYVFSSTDLLFSIYFK